MVEPNTGFVFDFNEPIEDDPVDRSAPVDWDAIAEDAFDFDEPLFQEEIEDEVTHAFDLNLHAEEGAEDAQVNANHVAVEVLMEVGNHGKGTLHNGVSSKIAQEMGVHQRTVQRIWQDGQEGGVNNVVSKKMKNCGRKRIVIIPEVIQGVPLRVSKSTVHARLKEKQIKRHSNSVRSYLTPANKKARVEFTISMLDRRRPHLSTSIDMYNIVHMDEKWFYRTN
ncbi:hypothetical protein GQ55_4G219400 [Panicum hallii var. hallii]|uniref:Transposase Tc1-like domain-containing protein n=1 Tax=Panicum hallii var. hallii TaxID=1504633 RepID=A0A2T7DZC1_9POAL|nr:hypothetical protein GQ55_4G219400 [Panicum hallii var. hallii]